MRTLSLILVTFAVLALAACGKPEVPNQCVARELGNGMVSVQTSLYQNSCTNEYAAATMADYIGKHPEFDVEAIAFDKFGAVTTLRTTLKAEAE